MHRLASAACLAAKVLGVLFNVRCLLFGSSNFNILLSSVPATKCEGKWATRSYSLIVSLSRIRSYGMLATTASTATLTSCVCCGRSLFRSIVKDYFLFNGILRLVNAADN
jgi:hypothetical protein